MKSLQKAPVCQVCSVGTLLTSVYYFWPSARPAQPVGSLAMLVLVALARWRIPLRKTSGLEEPCACVSACAHVSVATQQQPWLLVQAPASFLLLNFHFPATLKGPLAPAYLAGAHWSLCRHSSMFPHQLRGKSSTHWMAHSRPGRCTNHTENTEGSSAESAKAGAPASGGDSRHRRPCSGLSRHHRAFGRHGGLCQGGPAPRRGHRPHHSLQTRQQINRQQWPPKGASRWRSPSAPSEEMDRFQRQCYVYSSGGCVNKSVQGIHRVFWVAAASSRWPLGKAAVRRHRCSTNHCAPCAGPGPGKALCSPGKTVCGSRSFVHINWGTSVPGLIWDPFVLGCV